MSDCIATAVSRKRIREIARNVRKMLGLEHCRWTPAVELLDVLSKVLDLNYEIVPNNYMPKQIHATIDIKSNTIKIKEHVYNKAAEGDGVSRFTIVHELGHYFMINFCGYGFTMNLTGEKVPAFCDPEWQADCFAGEFLMPFDLVKDYSVEQIMEECGVSEAAAKCQYKAFRRTKL